MTRSENLSKDHRVRVTQMLIRRAFLSLLNEKPIQAISVKELCSAADINRSTFYAHYQDVYALLEQIESELLTEIGQALAPIYENATKGEHFLVEVCVEIFKCLKRNADLCMVMMGDYSDKPYINRLLLMGKEACLRAYSKHFVSATPRQIEYFYAFVSYGCIGLIRQWLQEGMTTSELEIAQMAETMMLSGIGFLSGQEA